jgi:hypothetical protein
MLTNDFFNVYQLSAKAKKLEPFNSQNNVCRFCNKTFPEVTFNTVTHIIPELFGKNNYISADECDSCNSKFSSYESHLAAYFRPFITMTGIKGKKGIPNFHSRTIESDENTRTKINHLDNGLKEVTTGDESDFIINEDSKTIAVTFRKPPHKPFLVYKSLVKVGLSILPTNKIDSYSNVFEWLLNDKLYVDYFPFALTTILTRNRYTSPFAELYLAEKNDYYQYFIPTATLVLGFGNLIIQIYLPLPSDFDAEIIKNKTPNMITYYDLKAFQLDNKSIQRISKLDLRSRVSIYCDETLYFSYDTIEPAK